MGLNVVQLDGSTGWLAWFRKARHGSWHAAFTFPLLALNVVTEAAWWTENKQTDRHPKGMTRGKENPVRCPQSSGTMKGLWVTFTSVPNGQGGAKWS